MAVSTLPVVSHGARSTYLNEVLALGFGDERLELGCGEGVNETGFRDDQEEHLGAGKDRQFVRLGCVSAENERVQDTRGGKLTFFMIPALRLLKVICRRDLSVMYSILILRRPDSPPSLST